MDFYFQQKLEQNPLLIFPACLALFFLLKFLIFAAKLAFMPCGVNVRNIAVFSQLVYCVVDKISWKEEFRKEEYKYNLKLGW